jgi:hypothetical protein
MKHARKVVEFAILSKSLYPAYSSRKISKLVFQKFGVNISHVTINHWIHTPAKVLKRQQEKECSMSELKLFDQLLTKGFATATMGAYGKVLVIPSKDFENDWSDILGKEGHHVYAQSYEGRSAFLVAFEHRVVTSPAPPEKIVDTKDKNPFWWSPDDEKRLLKRMKEVEGVGARDKVKNLLSEFPGRTFYAVLMKYVKLTKYVAADFPDLPQTAEPPKETATASSEKETALAPHNEIESLKNQLQEAQEKFLCPENLATIAATLLKHQTTLFERVSQTTSDEFDSEVFEETAVDLSTIEDISKYVAGIHNILTLKLKIQRSPKPSS